MATATDPDLFQKLRDNGMSKKAARRIREAIERGNRRAPKQARKIVADLRDLATDIEDRAAGGKAKRKRSEAAKKASRTRKRNKAKAKSKA